MILLVLRLIKDVGQAALPAVLTVVVGGHEDAGPALLGRTLASQTVDLPVVVDLVVLQHGQLHLPVLVLDLLGGGVVLLLPLLGTSPQPKEQECQRILLPPREHHGQDSPKDKVEGGLLLDIIVGQSPAILKLLAWVVKRLSVD